MVLLNQPAEPMTCLSCAGAMGSNICTLIMSLADEARLRLLDPRIYEEIKNLDQLQPQVEASNQSHPARSGGVIVTGCVHYSRRPGSQGYQLDLVTLAEFAKNSRLHHPSVCEELPFDGGASTAAWHMSVDYPASMHLALRTIRNAF